MSTLRRIGTGCLVGLVFAAGYTARLHNMVREEAFARAFRQAPVSAPGTQVASAGLESAGSIDLRPLEIMLTVLKSLREHYVDQISPKDEGKMTMTPCAQCLRRWEISTRGSWMRTSAS